MGGKVLALAALAVLSASGVARAQEPRMTRHLAIQVANKDLGSEYGDGDARWADGSEGLQNLTLWRLSMSRSSVVSLNGKTATNQHEADEIRWKPGATVVKYRIWHRFRWRYTGHCARLDRASLKCPIRLDLRWLRDPAWKRYEGHRPPAQHKNGTFTVSWVDESMLQPWERKAWLPHRTMGGVTYIAVITAGKLPMIEQARGLPPSKMDAVPTPPGFWYDWDGSGWILLNGPGANWQGGGDVDPPGWWNGTWRVPWPWTRV